jgi:hypothetical protein
VWRVKSGVVDSLRHITLQLITLTLSVIFLRFCRGAQCAPAIPDELLHNRCKGGL